MNLEAHNIASKIFIEIALNSLINEWTNEFLRQVSQDYPDDYMLLVMDNAIWHKSSILEIPSNIELVFIPSYTLEMNPIEQVWKEIRKRGFKNKAFQTLEAVIDKLQEVIQGLEKVF